jgi:hypothetical protein
MRALLILRSDFGASERVWEALEIFGVRFGVQSGDDSSRISKILEFRLAVLHDKDWGVCRHVGGCDFFVPQRVTAVLPQTAKRAIDGLSAFAFYFRGAEGRKAVDAFAVRVSGDGTF